MGVRNSEEDCGRATTDPTAVGVKADAGKPRPGLLPPVALMEVSAVLEDGARRYADDNWRRVPGWRWRYLDAMLRHILRWMAGETRDAKSGFHPLAHATCCVLFLLELELQGAPKNPVE